MIPWVLLTEFKPGCVHIGFIFSTFEVEDLKEGFKCQSLHWSCLFLASCFRAYTRLASLSPCSVQANHPSTTEDCELEHAVSSVH